MMGVLIGVGLILAAMVSMILLNDSNRRDDDE